MRKDSFYGLLSVVRGEANQNLNILLIVFNMWSICDAERHFSFCGRCCASDSGTGVAAHLVICLPANLIFIIKIMFIMFRNEVLGSEISLLWADSANVLFITGATGLKVRTSSSGNFS